MTTLNSVFTGFQAFAAPQVRSTAAPQVTAPTPTLGRDAFVGGAQAHQPGAAPLRNALAALNAREKHTVANLGALSAKAANAATAADAERLTPQVNALTNDIVRLGALKQAAKRVAANPNAAAGDRERMAGLVTELAQGNISPNRAASLQTEAEDIARNAGRTPKSDRALYGATQNLTAALSNLNQRKADLAAEVTSNTSATHLAQIQLELQSLNTLSAKVEGLKRQADRLADQPNAAPDAARKMSALIQEAAAGNVAPQRLSQITGAAEDLARNASRSTPSDRSLANWTQSLDARLTMVDQRAADLATEASNGNISTLRLQQIQIAVNSLKLDQTDLGNLKAEADRVADNKATTSDQAHQMRDLVMEANSGNITSQRLHELVLLASHVGK